VASDDGTETDVNADYAGTAEIADVAASEGAGTSPKVARGDHVHAHTAAQHASGGAIPLYSIVEYVFTPDVAPGANITAGVQSLYLHSGPNAETAVRLYGDCVTAAGTAFTATIEQGDTDDLDTVATWTDIATIAMGTSKSVLTDTMADASIDANKLLRLNIDTVTGTAPTSATFTLRVRRPLST
jgi:hypothetical protein